MPYTKGGPYTVGGPGTSANANNWETQYDEATQSFERDLFTPFVFSGCTSAKDGTIASQLNVAAGIPFVLQTEHTPRIPRPPRTNLRTNRDPHTTTLLLPPPAR